MKDVVGADEVNNEPSSMTDTTTVGIRDEQDLYEWCFGGAEWRLSCLTYLLTSTRTEDSGTVRGISPLDL